jgi:hypothetical protein
MPLVNPSVKTLKAVTPLDNMKISMAMSASMVPVLKGIAMGAPGSANGDDGFGMINYVFGMSKDTTEGSPGAPCIRMQYPSMFRFRWVVKPGQRRIAIRAKQAKIYSTIQRPSLIVKANPSVGIPSDIVAYAPDSSDWVLIGPTIFTATGTGMVFVEIHNNLLMSDSPAFFDHIVAT